LIASPKINAWCHCPKNKSLIEIINEGINGVIVSVKNTASLLLSMNEFVENSQLFYQLQTNSRSMIATRYNQQVIWEAIKNEYDQLRVTLY
jgi:glycosyltransferase involved in cell wall biosynthesis